MPAIRFAALACTAALGLTPGWTRHVAAADWPQFRGPEGQGQVSQRGFPLTWSESENITWKVPLPGSGWSSPVVQGSQIWLTAAVDNGHSLRALCVDRVSGKLVHDVEVFQHADPGRIHRKNSYASPTPIIDGDRVFVHYGAHGTACLSTAGKVIWRNNGLKYNHRHGSGGSPVVYGDLLIVSCDGTDVQFVVALDKHTGSVRWMTPREGRMAYSTPLVTKVDGQDELISTGSDRTIAYEPTTGKPIWSVRYDGYSLIPRPVVGEGMVFLCTGYDTPGMVGVKLGGHGDVTASHVVWKLKKGAPLNPSPVLSGGDLYMVSDQGIASCVEAKTGKVIWQKRVGGNFSASATLAEGRVYFLDEEGTATIVAASREYQVLAVNKLDGRALATPAMVDGAIFLRTDTHLYRIEQKGPRAGTQAAR